MGYAKTYVVVAVVRIVDVAISNTTVVCAVVPTTTTYNIV